jgi:hypothetical protein
MDSKQFDELVARLASGQSRREALKGIAGGALATVGVSSVVSSQGKKGRKASAQGKGKGRKASAERHKKSHCTKNQKREKFTICHKGDSIVVSACAWKRAHKRHGDHKGPCYG